MSILGLGSSEGINYGYSLPIFGGSLPYALSAPYQANCETMMYSAGTVSRANTYSSQTPSTPFALCHMLRRSLENCVANNYTYDSKKNRCEDEREDWLTCLLRGKERRFENILGDFISTAEGERTYVKYLNDWDKVMYDKDQGDILDRATNVQNMYQERGLKGQKWWGNRD